MARTGLLLALALTGLAPACAGTPDTPAPAGPTTPSAPPPSASTTTPPAPNATTGPANAEQARQPARPMSPAAYDWSNATFTVPPNTTGCRPGSARFRNGVATVAGTRYRIELRRTETAEPPVFADVNHDGVADALLTLGCVSTHALRIPLLVAISARTGTARTIGLVFSSGRRPSDEAPTATAMQLAVKGATVRFIRKTWEGNGACRASLRFDGRRFAGPCVIE